MAQVKWTLQAVDDLSSIAEFIAKDSPYYAHLFVINIVGYVERLSNFPKSGRIVPEINPDFALAKLLLGQAKSAQRAACLDTVETCGVNPCGRPQPKANFAFPFLCATNCRAIGCNAKFGIKNPLIREIITGNYRIIYRFQTKTVEILTVYHGAKLLNSSKIKVQ